MGCVYLDEKQYVVGAGGVVLVKIYGKVNDVSSDRFVYVTIKEPNGKLSDHKIPVTGTGDFVYPLPISSDKRGKYDVVVRGEYNPSGSKIGSVWFEVVKTSDVPTRDTSGKVNTPQPKDITTTSIVLATDSKRYEKGSIIGIGGQLVPYQSGVVPNPYEVTIMVISPNGNIKNVAQIRPSSIGLFESTVNTSNWSDEGIYKIKVNYANLIKSTSFYFAFDSSSPISKTSTFLILDSLPTTFNAKGSDSRAVITLSGQLLTVNKKTQIPGEPIKLVFTGFTLDEEDHYEITTDNKGKFNKVITMPTGKDYGVQAVYDGSLKFQSFESQTKYFSVVLTQLIQPQSPTQSIQPQSPTPSSGSFDPSGLVALVIVAVIMVAIIAAIKRRKKTPIAPLAQQRRRRRSSSKASAQSSSVGSTAYRTYTCPKCGGGDIQQNLDGSEFCLACGWKN